MKKTILGLTLAAALALPAAAGAHCGSCGIGGEESTQEECAAKCADAGDDAACVQECLEKHEADHAKEKSE